MAFIFNTIYIIYLELVFKIAFIKRGKD